MPLATSEIPPLAPSKGLNVALYWQMMMFPYEWNIYFTGKWWCFHMNEIFTLLANDDVSVWMTGKTLF